MRSAKIFKVLFLVAKHKLLWLSLGAMAVSVIARMVSENLARVALENSVTSECAVTAPEHIRCEVKVTSQAAER